MHQASESIGAIAAALAKAQAELTNPEKSLTATIPAPGTRGGERSFRYASLSSGLDIVRKILGRYELAAVQTTAIDTATRLVRLNTVLAHSSGEWISSEWPVCPITEMASPRRMGAALTYARRYALFTLVGIAGEDDLDAPDTNSDAGAQYGTVPGAAVETAMEITAQRPALTTKDESAHYRRGKARPAAPMLTPPESGAQRGILMEELAAIGSDELLTEWAHRKLPIKNALTEYDAKAVEEAFEARLQTIIASATLKEIPELTVASNDMLGQGLGTGIDKSVLAISEPKRHRNKAHLKYVATQACMICGREPSDPHHLTFAQPRALGRKVSDEYVVPLCRSHHRELHRSGRETDWWKQFSIEPLAVATALWARTRLPERSTSLDPTTKPRQATAASSPDAPSRGGARNRKRNERHQ